MLHFASCCEPVQAADDGSLLLCADTCPLYAVEVVGMVAAFWLAGLSVKGGLKLTEDGTAPSAAQGVYQGRISNQLLHP